MKLSIEWSDIWPKAFLLLPLIGLSKLISFVKLLRRMAERKKQLPFPDIPYTVPDPHWLLGHMKLLGAKDAVEYLHQLCVESASPEGVSTYWHANQPGITFLDAKHAVKLCRFSSQRILFKGTAKHFKRMLGESSLIMAMGKTWKSGRNVVSHAFVPQAMDDIQLKILKVSCRFEEAVKGTIDRSKNGTFTVDAYELSKFASLDIFGLSALNHDFECTANGTFTKSKVEKWHDYFNEEFTRRCYQSMLNPAAQFYWIPVASNLRHNREVANFRQFLKGIIHKRRVEFEANMSPEDRRSSKIKDGSLLDHLIHGSLVELGKADEDYLSEFLITLIYGGFDTMSLSTCYTLYLLAKHPEVEAKCVEEARRVLGKFPSVPYINSVADLPYCNAVVNESLRLYPPVAALIRNLGKDMDIEIDDKQVKIPMNTRVFIPLYWSHRYEKNFARAYEFLPERWVQKQADGTWKPRTFDPNEKCEDGSVPAADINNLLSFSTGGRSCVGERFARRIGPAILAFFLRSFKAELSDPDYVAVLERSGPNQTPIGGIPMVIRPRD